MPQRGAWQGLEAWWLVALVPRLTHGCLAAATDVVLLLWATEVAGPDVGGLALVAHLTTWFTVCVCVRVWGVRVGVRVCMCLFGGG